MCWGECGKAAAASECLRCTGGRLQGACKPQAVAKAAEFALAAAERRDPEDESSTPPAASAPAVAVRAAGREQPPPRRPFRFLLLPLQRRWRLRPVSAVARCGGEDGARALAPSLWASLTAP